ncbi:MAG: 4-alpha-glucanotransferase, partial [Anaerolineaceae bacterium]|nr:4-alpha-glucanotransferase [Anaerolineaceae bacterium]
MIEKRSSGILLHPTSLPGPDGIGDLGPEAYRWVEFLAKTGCNLWQILPLGPTGYGDSPYQSFSAFAGNPYLVSPALLLEDGLLNRADLADRPSLPNGRVAYGEVIPWKLAVLDRAFERFNQTPPTLLSSEFETFKQTHAGWLGDYSLFMALKEAHGGASWDKWEPPLRMRQPKALAAFQEQHTPDVQRHQFRQFLFFHQWQALRQDAAQKGIRIIGDIPIFVAFDSADAWCNPALFHMDENCLPTFVTGVPPDYFSPTGQLWGNPLYRWEAHAETGCNLWQILPLGPTGYGD